MSDYENEVVSKEDVELKEPSMYKCVLLNDDYTPMDFVVTVLSQIFNKNDSDANAIMLSVHKKGKGICGIYTFAIAETKAKQVEVLASKYEFPLICDVEVEWFVVELIKIIKKTKRN